MDAPLRVGVIGAGYIAEEHVKAWKNVGAKVVAICDKNPSIAEYKAKKWRVPKYYIDVHDMIREEKLDVVSICTPANVRLEVVKPVVEKGIHVVIEKPFAMSVEEAQKMVELKNKYGIKLTVVHNWLFSYTMKKVLHSLRKNEIGEILGFEMDLLHIKDDPMASNPNHWCHKLKAGRFGEMLPHPIYMTRAILGNVRVKHIFGSKLGSYPWMPIDELRVLLEDEKGRIASIYISFNSVRPETSLRIYGTKGIIDVNLSNNTIVRKQYRDIKITGVAIDNLRLITDVAFSSLSTAFAILTKRYKGMHTEFMKDFVKSLINNTNPPVTAEEALEVVKLHEELSSLIHRQYFTNQL